MANEIVTVNLSVPIPVGVLGDINQHFLAQTTGVVGTLAAPLDAVTTSVTVLVPTPAVVTDPILVQRQAAPPVLVVGGAVLIEGEPMVVTTLTAVEGGTELALSRGTLPSSVMAAHVTGVSIQALKYPNPWAMLVDEALRPWTISVIQKLGNKSMTLSSAITGSLE